MKKYLPDGSSEYCVCGHSAKDHEIRHVEGISTTYRDEEGGRRVTICKDWHGYRVFCWGKNTGGINCMNETEKRLAQKEVLEEHDGVFYPTGDPLLEYTVVCMCDQFRPYKRNDGKEPAYTCSLCDSIIKSAECPFICEYTTICSRCYEEDKCWKRLKRSHEFMREGYNQWEALKKATDELR